MLRARAVNSRSHHFIKEKPPALPGSAGCAGHDNRILITGAGYWQVRLQKRLQRRLVEQNAVPTA